MENSHLEFIKDRLNYGLAGYSIEMSKFDIKKSWYRFIDESGNKNGKAINEFYRDVCAMANSYGGGSGYIVIGAHENKVDKTINFYPAQISDSGFPDSADIKNLIKGNIYRGLVIDAEDVLIEVGGKERNVSVIHIHPTLAKPHMVTNYQSYIKVGGDKHIVFQKNVIFFRDGSTTEIASKDQLDLMYSERPTIQIEKQIEVSINLHDTKFDSIQIDATSVIRCIISSGLVIENLGFRVVSLHSLKLKFRFKRNLPKEFENPTFEHRFNVGIRVGGSDLIEFSTVKFKWNIELERGTAIQFAKIFNDDKSKYMDIEECILTEKGGSQLLCKLNIMND